MRLYHRLGTEILDRQRRQVWGAKIIERLAIDLREAFPDMRGLSASNLKYMRFFAEMCPDRQIGQQAADQLPWFHIVTLLTKMPDAAKREWSKPMGVAEYQLLRALPEPLDTKLPTIEELEEGLSAALGGGEDDA